jgi:prepilin-type N-terminal cleavage/methylation domain-containing protein
LRQIKEIKTDFFKQQEQGFSLIEVMLAALILSFAVVAFMHAQLMALRTSEQAYWLNLADLQRNELAERVRSCSDERPCIDQQLQLWKQEISETFPAGEGQIITQDGDYLSRISWVTNYQAQVRQSARFTFS